MNARHAPRTAMMGVLSALLALACATPWTPTTPATTAGTISVSRLVVAPLNLGLRAPSALNVDGEPVWDELVQYFHAQDRAMKVIDPDGAKRIWEQSFAELVDSGLKPDLASASQHFARRLAEHSDYDLLVMPSLVLRSARVRGGTVYWDGVRRKLPVSSVLPTGSIDEVAPMGVRATQWSLEGRVAAVSLHVAVLTSDGHPVYQGIGGIAVLQEAKLAATGSGSWELVDRTDAFDERASVSRGIGVAFERQLPAVAAAW